MWSLVDYILYYSPYSKLAGTLHPLASILISCSIVGLGAFAIDSVQRRLKHVPFEPAGKHVYITGGSTGLGKALAVKLVSMGAHVSISARRMGELQEALREMEAAKRSPDQKCAIVSADVTIKSDVVRALDEVTRQIGSVPEYVFTCAGATKPKLFMDHKLDELESSMNLNYLGQAYTIHEATKRMVAAGIKGRVVMVSSILGLMGFIGYSEYVPAKQAIRGLADTLRNELLLYDISVHVYFPGGILSPGFEVENRTKPHITKAIEGTNVPQTPVECAVSLIKGLQAGQFMIGTDLLTELLRCAARGVSPSNNWVLDWVMAQVGWLVATGWTTYTDMAVLQEKKRMLAAKKSQ